MSSTATSRVPLPQSNVTQQLRALGVEEGGVLLVHTSFKSVKPIEGGPLGLIAALRAALGAEGTLVMPSWSSDDETAFDPVTSEAANDLGIVARMFWRVPGVRRSAHMNAFAAEGPQAARILSDPLPLPPHVPESPVGRVYELDGQVLLLGVNHDANTTIHLAELLADVPYRIPKHCTVLRDGQPVRVDYGENDHCCQRFVLVDAWLRTAALQSEGPVGYANARLTRSRSVVRVVLDHLRDDRLLFLHPSTAACWECDQARRSLIRGGSAGA